MTVEERQGKENGHGARDPFPVGMRVLAVDDDPTCLKLLETLLLRCQYHVTTTGQAVTALNLLREKRDQFDLVISDVHMPDMDGFKLLEHVGLEMDLPVIMLSANGATQTVMEGITHGACDYLLKPVRIEELRNIWQHVVRRRSDARNRSNGNSDDAGQKVQSVNAEGEQGSGNRNRKHLRKDNGDDGDDSDGNSNENMDSSSQKKPRVVWSVELHRKFVAAVNQLGIDKAVPKKILDLMNVENITRENVASHLQKYRLYLKRLSTDASRQANLAAAFAGRNPAYINMSSLESFKQYHAYGRYRPVPAVASSQSSNLLARMNSPSAFGVHGLLPSQPIQVGHVQSNLGNALKDLGGASHGNLLKGGPMSLQEATKCFPTGPSGNSFANISNGVSLLPPNKLPVQSLEPSSQPSLRMHSSSTDPFNALVGEAPHFPDLARCSNSTWQTAVPSKFEEVGHKDSMPSSASLMNGPKIELQSSFSAQSGHVPMLGNELQSQAASITSSGTPMTGFNQETALFNFGSNTNSREMLNNNLAFSPSGMSSSLPSLCIDNSVVSSQTLDGGNASSIPSVHSRIDRQAVGDRLNYNNDFFMGTIKPQNGLSGGLDDIVVDMFKPDHGDAVPPFMDGDWELVSMP